MASCYVVCHFYPVFKGNLCERPASSTLNSLVFQSKVASIYLIATDIRVRNYTYNRYKKALTEVRASVF